MHCNLRRKVSNNLLSSKPYTIPERDKLSIRFKQHFWDFYKKTMQWLAMLIGGLDSS